MRGVGGITLEGRGAIMLRVSKTTLGKRLRGNNTGMNSLLA